VVMESTGDYWKGPYYRLEAEGFEMVLADAKQVRHLPGRPKNDRSDSRWLAACFERGAVTSCFVATPEFRIIREHTRYRRDLTAERTREKQRAEKLLESAAIKLSSVVTDLHGVTGRDIMDHLIAGERNPKVLAQLARARARRKIAQLEEALDGAEFFTPGLAALLARMLARIDQLNVSIDELSAVIETLLEPYEEQLQQAGSMPGWGRRSAQDAIAETGVDMTRFRTGAHLASWAGRTPLDNQSGSRTGRPKSKKGNRYLAAITGETAVAAGKTQTREGARYRRIAKARQTQSRRRGRQHPAEGLPRPAVQPRNPVPGPRRRLLRQPGQRPPPGQRPAKARQRAGIHPGPGPDRLPGDRLTLTPPAHRPSHSRQLTRHRT
jgi:transposase